LDDRDDFAVDDIHRAVALNDDDAGGFTSGNLAVFVVDAAVEQLIFALKAAFVLAGGGRPDDPALAKGWFYSPTVVLEPPDDSPMAREEVFGPALPIWRVKDLDEAIELANDTPFGLGSAVWTGDLQSAERLAAELDCGYTWINSPTKVYDELPFGGLKASGYGKEHGSEALDYYTDTKSVVVKRAL